MEVSEWKLKSTYRFRYTSPNPKMHIPIQNANNAMTDMERAENKGKYSDLLQFSLSILQCKHAISDFLECTRLGSSNQNMKLTIW